VQVIAMHATASALPISPRPSPERFVLALGAALHREGMPAHRLESALTEMGRRLDLRGQYFSTPTSLYAAFGPDGDQRLSLIRVEPGELHLEKLSQLDRVTQGVLAGELDTDRATAEIEAIVEAPDRYGPLLSTAAFAVVSASAAVLFGGDWGEIGAALAVGAEVGLLLLLATRFPSVARVLLPLAAAVAGAWAAILAGWLGSPSAHVITLAGLIVLVPGLTLTVSVNELSTGHLVSGTARMMGALVVFLQLGLGIVLGSQVGLLLPVGPADPVSVPLPGWAIWPATAVAGVCLTVLFRARPADLPLIAASCLLAMGGAKLGGAWLPAPGAAFVGALVIGLFGNGYARLSGRPSLIPIVPGLLLLVPGSVGFHSLSALLRDDALSGVQTAFFAGMSAVALAAGLLLAQAALGARKPY
jgi:uncharacterized membrane protein YjjP (DUF1212 family)